MLDDRVGRVTQPVGIDALLKRFGVDLLLGFATARSATRNRWKIS